MFFVQFNPVAISQNGPTILLSKRTWLIPGQYLSTCYEMENSINLSSSTRHEQSKTYPVTILSVPVLQKWTDVESQQGLLVPDTIMVPQMPKEHISWSLAFVTPSECSLKFIFSHKFLNIALNKHESCCIGSCFLTAGLRAIATMVAPANKSLFILNFFRKCGLVDWQQNKQSKTFLYDPSIIYYADSLSFRPIPNDFFPLTYILSIGSK